MVIKSAERMKHQNYNVFNMATENVLELDGLEYTRRF